MECSISEKDRVMKRPQSSNFNVLKTIQEIMINTIFYYIKVYKNDHRGNSGKWNNSYSRHNHYHNKNHKPYMTSIQINFQHHHRIKTYSIGHDKRNNFECV